MKKFPFVILFLFSLPLIIFYQPWVTALSPMPRHVSPEQLEKTVRYLTQTVHPRNAGNIDNLNRSVEYIKRSLSVAVPELPRRASPIGYYDSAPGSQNYPYPAMSWLYPDRGDFIAVVGRMQDINAVRQVKSALLSSRDLSVYSMNAQGLFPVLISLITLIIGNTIFPP